MSFSQAFIDARAISEGKAVRQLRAELERHGHLERRDLGTLQNLRARFPELPGATFDRVLGEVSKRSKEKKNARTK